jgi:hypothetical protein
MQYESHLVHFSKCSKSNNFPYMAPKRKHENEDNATSSTTSSIRFYSYTHEDLEDSDDISPQSNVILRASQDSRGRVITQTVHTPVDEERDLKELYASLDDDNESNPSIIYGGDDLTAPLEDDFLHPLTEPDVSEIDEERNTVSNTLSILILY